MKPGFIVEWMIHVQAALLQQKKKKENRMCGFLAEVKPNSQLLWDLNCKQILVK